MTIYQPIKITEQIEKSFKPTRLAVKECNGLKYLCKSVRKNFEKYKGSGKFWTSHIDKFGRENVKTLWISDWFYCPHHIQEFALMFGEYNQIVESKEWANLMPEYGIGGGNKYWKGKKRPDLSVRMSGKNHPQYGKKGELSPNYGNRHTDETKRKCAMFGPKNPRYGKPDIMKDPKYHKTCEHCGTTADAAKYARYHGEKCAQNPAIKESLTFTNDNSGDIVIASMFEFERNILLTNTKFTKQAIYKLRNGKSAFGWRISQV